MEDRDTVDVLYMGSIQHSQLSGPAPDKISSYQDEIAFQDPVHIELVRIPHHGRDLYKRMVSQTQVNTLSLRNSRSKAWRSTTETSTNRPPAFPS